MNPYIKMPLDILLKADQFVVKKQTEVKEFVNNVPTGNIIAQRYELIDVISYESFAVKLPEKKASIPQSMIEKAGCPLLVTLTNPKFSFYVFKGKLAMSFVADGIHLVDDEIDLRT